MAVKFVDEARIFIEAGDGGRGCISYETVLGTSHKRRCTGGNGGYGGDVVIRGNANLSTLMDFRFQQHFKGQRGGHGSGANRTGRCGDPCIIELPLGTVLTSEQGDQWEILNLDETLTLQKGGKGGQGNGGLHLGKAEPDPTGGEIEGFWVKLELKLMADFGVVGMPNAGKSSFVRAISGAKPKVGDYPFTTLAPNLGVVQTNYRSFTIADIPGLIEGAHQGVGLGNRFLRHVSRVKGLIFMVDVSAGEEEALKSLKTVENELEKHDAQLLQRPSIVLLNKVDLLEQSNKLDELIEQLKSEGKETYLVSAKEGNGLDDVIEAIAKLVGVEEKPREI